MNIHQDFLFLVKAFKVMDERVTGLKLRAWDTIEKRYVQIERISFHHLHSGVSHTITVDGKEWVASRFVLELWTGLTDKNGLKIYEGDILKHSDTWYPEVNAHQFFVVRYVLEPFGGYCACNETGNPIKAVARLFDDDGYVTEVIGNIHEHPDLIKK